MEVELQELRDLVAQLMGENERLRQEQAVVKRGPGVGPSIPVVFLAGPSMAMPL